METILTLTAIYENGILRPLTPVALPEQSRVQIRVERLVPLAEALEHRRLVREALIAAGLSLPVTPLPAARPISDERRSELAQRFAAGCPLSELIIRHYRK